MNDGYSCSVGNKFNFNLFIFAKKTQMRFIFLIFSFFVAFQDAAAQCDSKVEPSDNSVLKYRQRGNRCEGFYRSLVSRTATLEMVSCTWGDFRFKKERGEIITLQAPSAGENTVRVYAQGIPVSLYYRMDAELKGGESLTWAADDVLLRDPYTSHAYNIGILAYTQESEKKVYFPVKSRSKFLSAATHQQVTVKLAGNMRVSDLKWQLDGSEWNAETGPFPDGRPIKITLPAGLKSGRHLLEIKYRAENDTKEYSRRIDLKL